jgi:hypothetical protein
VTSEVWRLDLEKLQWDRMPSLTRERFNHARCVVRGRVVVLGGRRRGAGHSHTYDQTASVDILGYDDDFSQWKLHPDPLITPLRSPSTKARVSWVKCFSSIARPALEAVYRRCTRLTWRLGSVLRSPLFSLLGNFGNPRAVRLRACRTGGSFAREEFSTAIVYLHLRCCWSRLIRERRRKKKLVGS